MPWKHREGLVLGNAVGVIDADYEGECLISAWNRNPPRSKAAITVRPGERIAQLVLTRVARPEFVLVSRFGSEARQPRDPAQTRGAGGFGSTGVEAACPGRFPGRNSRA